MQEYLLSFGPLLYDLKYNNTTFEFAKKTVINNVYTVFIMRNLITLKICFYNKNQSLIYSQNIPYESSSVIIINHNSFHELSFF